MSAQRQLGEPRRRANARLAWVLASTAVVFALGFVAKVWLLSN
jgi:hypothetical protein